MRLTNTRICKNDEEIGKIIRKIALSNDCFMKNGKIESVKRWVNKHNGEVFTIVEYSYENGL